MTRPRNHPILNAAFSMRASWGHVKGSLNCGRQAWKAHKLLQSRKIHQPAYRLSGVVRRNTHEGLGIVDSPCQVPVPLLCLCCSQDMESEKRHRYFRIAGRRCLVLGSRDFLGQRPTGQVTVTAFEMRGAVLVDSPFNRVVSPPPATPHPIQPIFFSAPYIFSPDPM